MVVGRLPAAGAPRAAAALLLRLGRRVVPCAAAKTPLHVGFHAVRPARQGDRVIGRGNDALQRCRPGHQRTLQHATAGGKVQADETPVAML